MVLRGAPPRSTSGCCSTMKHREHIAAARARPGARRRAARKAPAAVPARYVAEGRSTLGAPDLQRPGHARRERPRARGRPRRRRPAPERRGPRRPHPRPPRTASTRRPPPANRRSRSPAARSAPARTRSGRSTACEFDRATELIGESRAAIEAGLAAVADHPDVRFAGYLQDAQKEYAEARITLGARRRRGPADPRPTLGVEDAPYLNGMAEAIGEGRRHILDLLRAGDVARASRCSPRWRTCTACS